MRKILIVLLAALLTAGICFPAAAKEATFTFEYTGLELPLSDELADSLGYVLDEDLGALDFGHHAYLSLFTYYSMPREVVQNATTDAAANSDLIEEILSKECVLRLYLSTDAGLDAAKQAYDLIYGEKYPADFEQAMELGQSDGFTFYAVPTRHEDYVAGLTEEYANDLKKVEAILMDGEKKASFHAPVDPAKEFVGKKLEFNSTDLDGNPVTSQELFAQNKFTLVNVWGTWCGNCMGEMEELAELHEKMKEKGCGLVGLNYEQTTGPEAQETAKQALKDAGATFPNALVTNEICTMCTGYPTTFFVDSEGIIQICPIAGAKPMLYEPAFESLLNGGVTEAAVLPAGENPQGNPGVEFAGKGYTVIVKDENGPVQGVMIQFCDDQTCRLDATKEDGTVLFDVPEGKQYDVHILVVPEGYEEDTTTYHTEASYGQTELTLKKK